MLLWPFFSLLLTLPILAYLYHRDGCLRFASIVATYLSVLYVLGIGCFTLYPLPSGTSGPGITYGIPPNLIPFNFIGDIAKDGLKAVFQILFNVVFFMPLGFIAKRLLRMHFPSTLFLALTTSVLIETAQLTGLFGIYSFAYRCFDVDDILCNTLGAVLGWFVACAFGRAVPNKMHDVEITDHPGFVRRCVALWLDLSMVGLASFLPWLAMSLVFELVFGRPLTFPGMDPSQTASTYTMITGFVALVLAEVIVPWMRKGSTLGGSFVRMTVETRPRTPGHRVLFYVVRTATLVITLRSSFFMVPVLIIFYIVKRCMPYDLIP